MNPDRLDAALAYSLGVTPRGLVYRIAPMPDGSPRPRSMVVDVLDRAVARMEADSEVTVSEALRMDEDLSTAWSVRTQLVPQWPGLASLSGRVGHRALYRFRGKVQRRHGGGWVVTRRPLRTREPIVEARPAAPAPRVGQLVLVRSSARHAIVEAVEGGKAKLEGLKRPVPFDRLRIESDIALEHYLHQRIETARRSALIREAKERTAAYERRMAERGGAQ